MISSKCSQELAIVLRDNLTPFLIIYIMLSRIGERSKNCSPCVAWELRDTPIELKGVPCYFILTILFAHLVDTLL